MKFLLVSLLVCLLSLSGLAQERGDVEKDVVSRFVFIGCNRVGFEVPMSQNPSTANVQQLMNTFNEVAAMKPRPSHLFFIGDLIRGYTSLLSTLEQLRAWQALHRQSDLFKSDVALVPVVGNHEVLLSIFNEKQDRWNDYPNPTATQAWQEEMEPYLRWRDGPTTQAPNLDSLTMDQSDLSFSVVDGNVMFICLNTDTFVDNVTTGDIPLHWLEKKLSEGQESPDIEHIFVMGHKPLVMPDMMAWIVREEERQPAIDLLNAHSKVRAFLTSHYHFWDYRLMPGGLPQIIAGNGGSPLKGPFLEPGNGYFGYTLVEILANGDIVVESWGRPVPDPYSSTEPQPQATLRETRVIKR
jgi:calcineurin-like phosphoesterase family protein